MSEGVLSAPREANKIKTQFSVEDSGFLFAFLKSQTTTNFDDFGHF